MLSAFPVVVCAQDVSLNDLRKADAFAIQTQPRRRMLLSLRRVYNGDVGRDALRRRAEVAAKEGHALREKQTDKGFNQAIAKLQKSLRLFKAASLYSQAADVSLQMGEIYFTLSRYNKALSYYHEAVQLGDKTPNVRCMALSRVTRTYATTGQEARAEIFSNQALSQCNSLADPRLRADALEARGEVLWNSGKSPESAEVFSQAQKLFEQVQDKNGQARSLLMGAYANFQNDRPKALQLAAAALRLWQADGDLRGVAEVHNQLGIFAGTTDEFEMARCNYEKSLPIFHRMGDRDNEASALNGIGYTSRETGDMGASLENYRRAKIIFAGVHDGLGTVEAITGMGKALSAMHQYRQLLPLYEQKLRIAYETGNIGLEASALADMAGGYELQHQSVKARAFYQRSLDRYIQAENDYGAGDTLIRLALLHANQGEDSQAIDTLERARALKDKTGQIGDLARIYYELATIYRRLNRLEDARTTIEKTIEIIESQRLKIANFDSRAAYFSSVHKYYALYIQILMLLDQQDPQRGFRKLAFEASEKSKVRALLDLLNASEEDSPCDELLQRQLTPQGLTGPNKAESNPASPVLALQQIQAEIGDDDTILEYALGDEKSYVWVVDQNQLTVYELPKADKIENLAHVFHNMLTAREPRAHEKSLDDYRQRVRNADLAYPQVAQQLSQLLLGSLNLSRAKRLLIVADGFLQYIPFSALPLPQAGRNYVPLITTHEVVVLPSASALGTLRKAAEKRTPPTRTAIIVADPIVDSYDPRLPHARNSIAKKSQERPDAYTRQSPIMRMALRDIQGSARITRLKGAAAEAEAIQRILGPREALVKLGFSASRDFVLQGALAPYRIIHFATHGIIDAHRPEMSGLVLSLINKRGHPQEGYLRLADIYKLKLSADLVVLSACSSALGKDLESEGTIGLPRGFLYAGSRSVIASVWKVDDDAAAAFMKSFYARIQQHEVPSSALRGAQLEMLRGNRWPQPFYWAAFVLQGDYK